tara:strand:- start:966 stop:2528 length:1563 start_codon:yes stop_codon:yes gene_type:complete
MTVKVKVHYIANTGEVKTFLWSRAIRQMDNMIPGVNISGKVYPLYRGNFINLKEPRANILKSAECGFMHNDDARSELTRLAEPLFSDLAMDYLAIDKTKQLNEVLSKEQDLLNKSKNISFDKKPIPVEIQVNANDPNKLRMIIEGYEPQEFLQNTLNYSDVPNFSFPKYGDDWYFERSYYYSYVTVNESDERINNIKSILLNPGDYECLDAKPARAAVEFENIDSTMELPSEINTYLSPGPINSNIDNSKKTFLDRWGEHEFECKKSYRAAPNNIQYDYWFRFDLSVPDDVIKNMFEDILRVTEATRLLIRLETFLVHDNESSDELIKSNEVEEVNIELEKFNILKDEAHTNEELANSYSSENDELNKKIEKILEQYTSLDGEYMKKKEENRHLKEKINNLKRKELAAFERNLERYFSKFYFFQRGMKTVQKYYQSTEKLEEVLQLLYSKSKDLGLKRIRNTKHWEEVPKKISNGIDDQGRLYICKHGNQSVILIGSKQQQPEDFIYLQKNDPPEDLENI